MAGPNKTSSNQPAIFALALIIFLVAAAFGWEKLQYGFNFLDEGWHMTESWRLAAGDHFLKDKTIGAHMLYTLINSLIFKISPDISLLGFRKLQYILTIFAVFVFSIALFKVDRQYWYQPLVFSLFAFTGLSPIGWNSNLNYYSYPHLFLTLHLSFLVFGLFNKSRRVKRLMYILSGLFLWGISFTLLHLSVIVFSPILLFLACRKFKTESFSFGLEDCLYVLAPFVFCWLVFIGIYNKAYITSVLRSVGFQLSSDSFHNPGALIHINWEATKHIGASMLFLLIVVISLKKVRFLIWMALAAIMSILMFFIIDTSLFSLITPYCLGWYSRPMWFCSILISFFFVFLFNIVKKYVLDHKYKPFEELCIALLIPCTILSLISSVFSGWMGILNVLHCSIPVMAAVALVVLNQKTIYMRSHLIKFLVLLILLLPFYYMTAWSDWKYTYFDVFPEEASVTIEKGFGKGIKTNPIYSKLYEWIRVNSEKYTEKGDFMISYVLSPMAHMISKRIPSFNDTYITFDIRSMEHHRKFVEMMKKAGRQPKIAFVFESMPAFYPLSLKESRYKWMGKQFSFPSNDSISKYVIENMKLIEACKIHEGNIVRCFVDKKVIAENGGIDQVKTDDVERIREALRIDPEDPKLLYTLANLYKRMDKIDEAIEQYEKAVTIQPEFIKALNELAMAYATKGEYRKAISLFKKRMELQPDSANTYYNIACVYARQNKVKESIDWLDKALNMGYRNWAFIKTDKDLESIRGTSYYKKIIGGH